MKYDDDLPRQARGHTKATLKTEAAFSCSGLPVGDCQAALPALPVGLRPRRYVVLLEGGECGGVCCQGRATELQHGLPGGRCGDALRAAHGRVRYRLRERTRASVSVSA